MSRIRGYLFLAVFFAATVPTIYDQQQWVEVRSPHFSVVTDAGEKRGRDVILRFEQMRTAFGVIFQKVNVNIAMPLEIIAYRNSKELRQVAPLYQGKPISLAGYFLGGGEHGRSGSAEDRQYIALDLSAEDNWGTVFHEYSHLLINSNFPPTPVWFDEGFAEYCSSLKIDKKEIDLGLARPDLPATLSQNRWLKLVDLFSVSHDSKIYNRDDSRSVFYAQSWLAVHYFMSKHMMKQVDSYNRLVQDQHVAVPEAIRRAFSMEPEQLEKAIQDYFRNSAVAYFKAPAPPGSDNVTTTSRPLDEIEIKTIQADLDFHTRDYKQRGIASFEEIVSKQPDNAIANRGLGYAAMQKNDWDKAGEHFRRAAAQESKDPQVHYLLALLMSRKNMFAGKASSDLEIMKKELNTAIALDPNYADAYGLLGMTLSNAGEKENAINALKNAISLSPRNEFYTVNLVTVYLNAREFDQAVPLLKQLQQSSTPQIASIAEKQMETLEFLKNAAAHRNVIPPKIEEASTREAAATTDDDPKGPQEAVVPAVTVKPEPILFLKGMLLSVDCTSAAPGAVLTISSAGKKWKMVTPNAQKLIVMGEASELSCSWTNKKVAVNYRKSGTGEGKLVTLELE